MLFQHAEEISRTSWLLRFRLADDPIEFDAENASYGDRGYALPLSAEWQRRRRWEVQVLSSIRENQTIYVDVKSQPALASRAKVGPSQRPDDTSLLVYHGLGCDA
jgi:hypothetical protein